MGVSVARDGHGEGFLVTMARISVNMIRSGRVEINGIY